jgi:hypothetical protein
MSVVNDELRAHTADAEVLAALTSSRTAALLPSTSRPGALADEVGRGLSARMTGAAGAMPRVWIEVVPDDPARAATLVQELAR